MPSYPRGTDHVNHMYWYVRDDSARSMAARGWTEKYVPTFQSAGKVVSRVLNFGSRRTRFLSP